MQTRRSLRTRRTSQSIVNLYHERAGILDGDPDGEVDLGVPRLPDMEERHRRGSETGEGRRRPAGCRLLVACSTHPSLSGRKASSCSCAPPTAMTPSPMSTMRGGASLSPRSRFSQSLSVSRTRPAQPHHREPSPARRRGCSGTSSEKRSESAASSGDPRAPDFGRTLASKQYAEDIKGQLFDVDALRRAIDDIYQLPSAPVGCRHTEPPTPQRRSIRRPD